MIVLLPDPDGPTSAVVLPPSAVKLKPWKSGASSRYSNPPWRTRRRPLKPRARARPSFSAMEDFVSSSSYMRRTPTSPASSPICVRASRFRRLVGERDRRDERHQRPRLDALVDRLVARPQHDDGDGKPAQHFHLRARARRDAHDFVGALAQRFDRGGHAGAHRRLEVERLDDADALRRVLHVGDDHGLRGELLPRHAAHPPHQPVDAVAAIGPTTSTISDISGLCSTMTATSEITDSASRLVLLTMVSRTSRAARRCATCA